MKNQTRSFASLIVAAILSFSSYGQTNYSIQYSISIVEIDSEVAVKEADYILRPIFDVPGKFNSENGKILFDTNARIKREQLEERLLMNGYHLQTFEAKRKETRL